MVVSAPLKTSPARMVVIEMWSVWWTDSRHVRHFIDVDDLPSAELLAVHLSEADRETVSIAHDKIEWDQEALDSRRERLMARIHGDPASFALREISGA